VLNGVVMVTYFNQLSAQGMVMAEIVVEGAKRRLRPVLMIASIARRSAWSRSDAGDRGRSNMSRYRIN
jgi:hypothetical protein